MDHHEAPPAAVSPKLNRRTFLHRSTLLGAGLAGASAARQQVRAQTAANSAQADIMLGLIGCGRRGRQLLEAAARVPGVTVGMVCDVDVERAAAAAERALEHFGRRPVVTSDHRDVLDDPAVHAVIIATPDHWHAIQTLDACLAEKDLYLEVPLCLYPTEAKAIAYAVRKYKRVAQVGLHYRSSSRFAEAGGIVRSGTLGRIAQVRTWNFDRQEPVADAPDSEPPSTLDHDRWLGPAPETPFSARRYQRPEHFWDYGGGEAARWGIHFQDLVHAAMRVTVPRSVTAVGGDYGLIDGRETPDTLDVLFEYASPTGAFMQAYSLRLTNAYAGWGPAALPPAADHAGPWPARSGMQIFGSDRTLYVGERRLLLLPAGEESPPDNLGFLNLGAAEPTQRKTDVPDALTIAHLQDFAKCIRARTQPVASVEAAQWAMYPGIAANVAYRVGRKLYIHPDQLEFFGDPELKKPDEQANDLLFRPYRDSYPAPTV